MVPALTGLFEAVKLGLQRSPEIFGRLRMHFVGTTYAPKADGLYQVRPVAAAVGVGDYVEEHPGRVQYLDALRILLDSHALVVVGSELAHYTASKIFPYILARRPLLVLCHEASSMVRILQDSRAGELVTFSPERPATDQVEDISKRLEAVLSVPGSEPPTAWDAFERYTARSMTARLAQAFDRAIRKGAPGGRP
jgi:hypothetical protein